MNTVLRRLFYKKQVFVLIPQGHDLCHVDLVVGVSIGRCSVLSEIGWLGATASWRAPRGKASWGARRGGAALRFCRVVPRRGLAHVFFTTSVNGRCR